MEPLSNVRVYNKMRWRRMRGLSMIRMAMMMMSNIFSGYNSESKPFLENEPKQNLSIKVLRACMQAERQASPAPRSQTSRS